MFILLSFSLAGNSHHMAIGSTGDLPDLTLGGSTDALGPSYSRPHDLTSLDLLNDTDVDQLSLEIEKERGEYLERSRHLQQQLQHLKSEIEVRYDCLLFFCLIFSLFPPSDIYKNS